MARLRVKLLDDEKLSFGDIERLSPIQEGPDPDAWRGRFWLPDGNRVDPTRKHCLMRDDTPAGEMIMENFVASFTT